MEQAGAWVRQLDKLVEGIGHLFARSETRRRGKAYLQGLLSPAQRRNGRHLAKAVGEGQPGRIQSEPRALVPLTAAEMRRLVWLVIPAAVFVLGWSQWRRRYQAVAKACHYQKRQYATWLPL